MIVRRTDGAASRWASEDPPPSEPPLRALLRRAVAERPCEAILFSGGLDTSIVATLAGPTGTRLAVTVVVDDDAPDLPYATALARDLGLEHVVLRRSLAQLEAGLPELVRRLGTFDGMFLRNDIVIWEGLREVARRGARSCWTGDGADELFAGYSFMTAKAPDEIERTIRTFAGTMHFNGPGLGRSLGVEVRSPFLHPDVIAHAVALPGEAMVEQRDGALLGKAPLREAFRGVVPEGHRLRRKDPIEVGSGATHLRSFLTERAGQGYEAEAERVLARDGVRLRDPEHLAYYRIYRDAFGRGPRGSGEGPKTCPGCGAHGPDGTYCRVCGAYPI